MVKCILNDIVAYYACESVRERDTLTQQKKIDNSKTFDKSGGFVEGGKN